MPKILVIQGAGMDMRGKTQIEVYGPATIEQINQQVRDYAKSLSVEVEIFHSNIEGEVINALFRAHEEGVGAAVINPAGYTDSMGPLPRAITQVGFPVIEVHVTNPTTRGIISKVQPVCKGSIYGFGLFGYYLALEAAHSLASS